MAIVMNGVRTPFMRHHGDWSMTTATEADFTITDPNDATNMITVPGGYRLGSVVTHTGQQWLCTMEGTEQEPGDMGADQWVQISPEDFTLPTDVSMYPEGVRNTGLLRMETYTYENTQASVAGSIFRANGANLFFGDMMTSLVLNDFPRNYFVSVFAQGTGNLVLSQRIIAEATHPTGAPNEIRVVTNGTNLPALLTDATMYDVYISEFPFTAAGSTGINVVGSGNTHVDIETVAFTGNGVTVSADASTATINIPGGSGDTATLTDIVGDLIPANSSPVLNSNDVALTSIRFIPMSSSIAVEDTGGTELTGDYWTIQYPGGTLPTLTDGDWHYVEVNLNGTHTFAIQAGANQLFAARTNDGGVITNVLAIPTNATGIFSIGEPYVAPTTGNTTPDIEARFGYFAGVTIAADDGLQYTSDGLQIDHTRVASHYHPSRAYTAAGSTVFLDVGPSAGANKIRTFWQTASAGAGLAPRYLEAFVAGQYSQGDYANNMDGDALYQRTGTTQTSDAPPGAGWEERTTSQAWRQVNVGGATGGGGDGSLTAGNGINITNNVVSVQVQPNDGLVTSSEGIRVDASRFTTRYNHLVSYNPGAIIEIFSDDSVSYWRNNSTQTIGANAVPALVPSQAKTIADGRVFLVGDVGVVTTTNAMNEEVHTYYARAANTNDARAEALSGNDNPTTQPTRWTQQQTVTNMGGTNDWMQVREAVNTTAFDVDTNETAGFGGLRYNDERQLEVDTNNIPLEAFGNVEGAINRTNIDARPDGSTFVWRTALGNEDKFGGAWNIEMPSGGGSNLTGDQEAAVRAITPNIIRERALLSSTGVAPRIQWLRVTDADQAQISGTDPFPANTTSVAVVVFADGTAPASDNLVNERYTLEFIAGADANDMITTDVDVSFRGANILTGGTFNGTFNIDNPMAGRPAWAIPFTDVNGVPGNYDLVEGSGVTLGASLLNAGNDVQDLDADRSEVLKLREENINGNLAHFEVNGNALVAVTGLENVVVSNSPSGDDSIDIYYDDNNGTIGVNFDPGTPVMEVGTILVQRQPADDNDLSLQMRVEHRGGPQRYTCIPSDDLKAAIRAERFGWFEFATGYFRINDDDYNPTMTDVARYVGYVHPTSGSVIWENDKFGRPTITPSPSPFISQQTANEQGIVFAQPANVLETLLISSNIEVRNDIAGTDNIGTPRLNYNQATGVGTMFVPRQIPANFGTMSAGDATTTANADTLNMMTIANPTLAAGMTHDPTQDTFIEIPLEIDTGANVQRTWHRVRILSRGSATPGLTQTDFVEHDPMTTSDGQDDIEITFDQIPAAIVNEITHSNQWHRGAIIGRPDLWSLNQNGRTGTRANAPAFGTNPEVLATSPFINDRLERDSFTNFTRFRVVIGNELNEGSLSVTRNPETGHVSATIVAGGGGGGLNAGIPGHSGGVAFDGNTTTLANGHTMFKGADGTITWRVSEEVPATFSAEWINFNQNLVASITGDATIAFDPTFDFVTTTIGGVTYQGTDPVGGVVHYVVALAATGGAGASGRYSAAQMFEALGQEVPAGGATDGIFNADGLTGPDGSVLLFRERSSTTNAGHRIVGIGQRDGTAHGIIVVAVNSNIGALANGQMLGLFTDVEQTAQVDAVDQTLGGRGFFTYDSSMGTNGGFATLTNLVPTIT